MDDKRKKLISQLYITLSALFIVIIATVAWFIHNSRSATELMSFAAQKNAIEIEIYKAEKTENFTLIEDTDSTDGTTDQISNTVTWEPTPTLLSDFTFEIRNNMTPGQCDYYKIVMSTEADISLQGALLESVDPDVFPSSLGDYVAVYAFPYQIESANSAETGFVTKVDGEEKYVVTTRLQRTGEPIPYLENRISALTSSDVLSKDKKEYVVAVTYDYKNHHMGDQITVPGTVKLKFLFVS